MTVQKGTAGLTCEVHEIYDGGEADSRALPALA